MRLLQIHIGLVYESWMLYFPTPPEGNHDVICLAANGCGDFFKRTNQRHLRLGQAIESNDPPSSFSLKKKGSLQAVFEKNFIMSTALTKLFVGGLNVQTTDDGLRQYFEKYGQLSDCVVVINKALARSRCFGFITYSTPEEADSAMAASPHVVDGHNVELKRAVARQDADNPEVLANVKKIFVGGVQDHIEAEHLTDYFSQFGAVEKAEIISDKLTGKKRGFGFVFFVDTDSATKAVLTRYHTISGNKVEAKKAMTKQEMSTGVGGGRGRGRGMYGGGGGRGGGGYSGGYGGGYGGSYGGGYGYGGGYNGGGGYGGGYGGYNEYDNQMGGGYSNGDFGDGYGEQHSNYGAMKGGNYAYRSGAPYNRGGGGGYGRGGGYSGGY